MIAKNFFRTALDFIPKKILTTGHNQSFLKYNNIITTNNKIYLMNGPMPDIDILYEIDNEDKFKELFDSKIVAELENFELHYFYNVDHKERIIKKNVADAFDFTYKIDATIQWFAVVLEEFDPIDDGNIIIFSESIGVWEEDDRIIILESLSGTQGSPNIFKDFTLVMRDICNNEYAEIPATEFIDNDPGVIIINAISDNVITNKERLEDLIIDGTTIGIEDGQPIEVYFNDVRYNANVFNNSWSVTVPSTDVSNLAFDTTYQVKVECRDRAGNLSTATKDVYVRAKNIAPTIDVVSSITTDEDTLIDIPVTITDSDGVIKSIAVFADNGTVTYNSDTNNIKYKPNQNFNGVDTIRIEAKDELDALTIKNIDVTINSVNDNPIISINNNVTTDEDTMLEIPFTVNDIDGSISSITATASHGTITVDTENNVLKYLPEENFNGSDTIVLTVIDNENGQTIKNINVTVNSINDEPILTISDATTNEDTSVNIPYTASDIEGGVVITASATNGTAVVDLLNSQIVFTPDENFNGTATIDVSVTDSDDVTITKTVQVNVTPVNDAPIIDIETNITMDENTTKIIPYQIQDIDGTIADIQISESPNATISHDVEAHTISYTPNTDFIGNDSFTITAIDNDGVENNVDVNITVNNVDAAATITVDSSVTTDEDTMIEIPFTISDPDGEVTVTASALHGTVAIEDGKIKYTPESNFNGNDTITLTSTDTLGGSTTKEISVTINPVNDDATITVDSSVTTDEDTMIEIPFTISDPDGEVTVTASALHGTVTIEDGKIKYTPESNFNGNDTITLTSTDALGGSNTKEISVTINPVNDDATITVESSVTTDFNTVIEIPFTVSDPDGSITNETVSANNGSVAINENKITYTPNTDYYGDDIITLTVTDDKGGSTTKEISVYVKPENSAPIITVQDSLTVTTDSVTDFTYEVSDADNDELTVTVSNSGEGSVSINTSTKTISYDAPSVTGNDTITITVNDGHVNTIKTIDVTINQGDI